MVLRSSQLIPARIGLAFDVEINPTRGGVAVGGAKGPAETAWAGAGTFSKCQPTPGAWRLQRQSHPRFATWTREAVLKGKRATVRLGDLPAEDESDSRTRGLGREEWHKKVGGV